MLVVNQFAYVVLFGKTVHQFVLMLIHPSLQIVGYADVHDLVVPIGEDVNVEVVVLHKISPHFVRRK
jgi:hypothetical protein